MEHNNDFISKRTKLKSASSKWSNFEEATIYSTKPKMVKYQIKRGHAGLGGRIFRVSQNNFFESSNSIQNEKLNDILQVGRVTSESSRPQSQNVTYNTYRQKKQNRQQRFIGQRPSTAYKLKYNKIDNYIVFMNKNFQTYSKVEDQEKDQSKKVIQYTMADLSKNFKYQNNEQVKISKMLSPQTLCIPTQSDGMSKDFELKKPSTPSISQPRSNKKNKSQQEYVRPDMKAYQFIDQISQDDPVWKTIIPQEVFNTPNFDLQKLINDNYEYFHHQLAMCACFRCSCGQCKCDYAKQNRVTLIQQPLQTVYEKDFQGKGTINNQLNPKNQMNTINQMTYNSVYNDQPTLDLQSVHRACFKGKPVTPAQRYKEPLVTKISEFSGITTYKSSFSNWGSQAQYFKRPQHISTSDTLPFYGQTLYQNTFCKEERGQPAEILKNMSQLTPLPTGLQVIKETQNQKTYQPFKVLQVPQQALDSSEYNDNNNCHYISVPAFQGQFTSLQTKDFRGEANQTCPGKEYKKLFQNKLNLKHKQS